MKRIPAMRAFQNLRSPTALWPSREDPDNRIEPIAKPVFAPTFKIKPGERVFTVGSCFARNIEEHLKRRGIDVPMLGMSVPDSERQGRTNSVLNKYNVYSIANAVHHACEGKGFPLYEEKPGEFFDLQLFALKPTTRERGMQRQLQINDLIRNGIKSNTMVVTLGLAEAWYDNEADLYCNITPPWPVVEKDPDRFEFRVLGYDDIYTGIKALMSLLDRVANPGYRMLLTVSPVPLTATFTERDVLVANTYSKSVQRAAVEAILNEYPQVDYFPSYESVTLSDRKLAYETKERTHVTDNLVGLNVERMLAAYT